MKKLILVLTSLFIFSACHRDGSSLLIPTNPATLNKPENKPCDPSLLGFADVKPLFERNCKTCHQTGGPLADWTDYKTAFSLRSRLMDRVIIKKDMPMGQPLAAEDYNKIKAWLEAGALEKTCDNNSQEQPSPPAEPMPPMDPAPPTEPVPPVDPAPPIEEPQPIPTFEKEIKPLIKKYCVQCHFQDGPLPNWLDKATIQAKKDSLMDRVVIKKDMPFGQTMTEEEILLFKRWLEAGAP